MPTDVTPDDELMERLRSLAATVDPVPDEVVLAGRSAIAHRDLDVRLAALVEEEFAASVRGGDEPWLTFEVDDVVIELAIRSRSGERHLVGQLDGAQPASVTVRHAGREISVPVDELGRFSTGVQQGPLRVEFDLDEGHRVATSWILNPAA